MTDEELIDKDIEALYLGNLGTVEFDLDLPAKGKLGSDISWESDMPHFLAADGTVSRPAYGRGNRTVTLTATFSHGDAMRKKGYQVQVLEQASDFEISRVYPVHLSCAAGEQLWLPSRVSADTSDGRTLSLPAEWEGGPGRSYAEAGTYEETGSFDAGKAALTATVAVSAQRDPGRTPEPDALTRVEARLTGGSDFKAAQDRMHEWLITTDVEDYLYNFRRAAGLEPRGRALIGWDSPDGLLRGHTGGHYLSALAKCWAATGDDRVLGMARDMVAGLAECQRGLEARGCAKGFLSAYDEKQFDLLEAYTPYPKIWAPYYTLHKILAGLLDASELCGIDEALTLARGIGDWAGARLGRLGHEQLTRMWGIYIAGEYGGMNEALARLSVATGDASYARTARLFDNDRLFFPLEQGVDALNGMHANQHIPQVIGAMELYRAGGGEKYLDIAERFWGEASGWHAYAIGGVGESEMFHAPGAVASLLTASTCESCASYNMLKLTGMLHEHRPEAALMDYYERTLFSHTLATTDKRPTGGTTYFISMLPRSQKEFDLGENSCCHGTGLEQPFMYADHVFHWKGGEKPELLVDLPIPAAGAVEGVGVAVKQAVDEGNPGKVSLKVSCASPVRLKVRIPSWRVHEHEVDVDGSPAPHTVEAGYLGVALEPGEHAVGVDFGCELRVEEAPDDRERYVAFFGPYALAAITDDAEPLAIPKEEARRLKPTGRPLEFTHGPSGTRFIPFERVDRERHQLYLMNSQSNFVSRS